MSKGKFPFGNTQGPAPPMAVRPPNFRDRYGRELHIGDQVIGPSIQGPVLRVAEIKPDLRPGAQPGQVLVSLVSPPLIFPVPGDQPIVDFIRVMQVAEYEKPKVEETPPDKKTDLVITD